MVYYLAQSQHIQTHEVVSYKEKHGEKISKMDFDTQMKGGKESVKISGHHDSNKPYIVWNVHLME